jgi:hypothetical protein
VKIKLNIVPFGKRGKDKKNENFPSSWRKWKYKCCPHSIDDCNAALVTGNVPGQNYKIVAFDLDGDLRDVGLCLETFKDHGLFPLMINSTANNGLHFIFVCDKLHDVRNAQGNRIAKGIFPEWVEEIHIRGDGGLIYFPPTEYTDGMHPYGTLLEFEPVMLKSKRIIEFIKKIYDVPYNQEKMKVEIEVLRKDLDSLVHGSVSVMRKPLRDLVLGCIDIEELSKKTRRLEYLYWKAIWLEAIYKKVDYNVLMRLLEKNQPAFDREETIRQLNYLTIDSKPFTNDKLAELCPWWNPKKKHTGIVY